MLLAKTLFPEDSVDTDQPYHTELRAQTQDPPKDLPGDDPPFASAELELVLRTLNPKKAPGADGLTADICVAAIQSDWEVFLSIANKCLSLKYFPTQWKSAHVVILRKPGKTDYTQPKSYRPIGLLSVLGKIVEKLMVNRIQWHILPTLSRKQYGFMPQRGTEDALYDLVEHIKKGVNSKQSVLLVSLDIEGAFDNAWWPALKHQIAKKRCPSNLYMMVHSYLSDRKIKVHYAGAECERVTSKGCVQGSIGGPTFWNIILDSLLRSLEAEGVYCQAFADDVVLVFTGPLNIIEEQANKILDMTVKWGNRNKLNFAAHKTNTMLLTKKLKFETPNLVMSDIRLAFVDEIKLLGLLIDRRLTFKTHVNAQCKKVADIYKQLACAAKVTWGLNNEIIRTIYVAVVEPIILYASNVWAQAADLEENKSHLNALQRGFAQKICKSYRTVSLKSALVLSGLIPLDLRVHETANLYRAKKNFSHEYLPPEVELECDVNILDQPHPSRQISVQFQLLETVFDQLEGPQIYTDGSKIEGQVGAALTWWENGREVKHAMFKLHSECTVFQSELYALYQATQLIITSGNPEVNVLSDSLSSLELLRNPKTSHPLVKRIKENIGMISAEGRTLRLFWVKAHVGTAGNERADELAKLAAFSSAVRDYEEIPLSYVKRRIREESIRKWQDRYETSDKGRVTQLFFPDVAKAYRVIRTSKLTPFQVQTLTGHGGIAEYLYRFKLKDSPGCECDSDVSESVWHVLLDCPRFMAARQDLEMRLDRKLVISDLRDILEDSDSRSHFLSFAEKSFRTAAKRNSTLGTVRELVQQPNAHAAQVFAGTSVAVGSVCVSSPKCVTIEQLLESAEGGKPGLRIGGVALFMDGARERFGISFCHAWDHKRARLSPGLARLLNGSTAKVTMKRKTYDSMPVCEVEGHRFRLVRSNNKTIALFESGARTPFAQAGSFLSYLSKTKVDTPRVLSVDAMKVEYSIAEVEDRLGCIKVSEHHEVVVYEDRGENLSFLKTPTNDHTATNSQNLVPGSVTQSGSEKLQQKAAAEKDTALAETYRVCRGISEALVRTLSAAARGLSQTQESSGSRIATTAGRLQTIRTRADKGQIDSPRYITASGPRDHAINAFVEFIATLRGTREVYFKTCDNILQAYRLGSDKILREKLEEAQATIYNNVTSQVIRGTMMGQFEYMMAYSAACGFVALDRVETRRIGKPKYAAPPTDPIVVIARCTKTMLDDGILDMAKTIAGNPEATANWGSWKMPKIQWINGVPGCGKTAWVIRQFSVDKDVIITTTSEAAKDLRERLSGRIGNQVKTRVRTMASVLVNGFDRVFSRLLVDEALMNHFGAIIMAVRLSNAGELVLIGDINQLPYIDRENLFDMRYGSPNLITEVCQELLCTHRCPMDVAYALREIYSGIYSSVLCLRSLEQRRYTGANISRTLPNTLYLVHTQEEKEILIGQGYGEGAGSCTLTIHEAQGLTYESVVAIKTKAKLKIHESVPHAVVALSRHTGTFVYYTDDVEDDAICRFVLRTSTAPPSAIRDYNFQMAIKDRNAAVMEALGRGEALIAKYV